MPPVTDSGTLASELVFGAASALLLCNDGSRQNCVLGTLDRCLAYYRQMDAEAFDISAVRVTLQALVKAISQTTPRFDNESLLFLLEMEVPSIAATPPRTSQMSLAESLSSEPAGSPRSIDLETAQLSALAAVFWSAADADLLWNALIGRPAQLPKSFLSDKQHERIKQISGALIDKLGSSSHGNLRPAHIVCPVFKSAISVCMNDGSRISEIGNFTCYCGRLHTCSRSLTGSIGYVQQPPGKLRHGSVQDHLQ